jgi:hypothetical protein
MAPLVVVCRKASDSLLPGAQKGYRCRRCDLEVQVTVDGRAWIAAGGIALCNDCGLGLIAERERRGNTTVLSASPTALAQIERLAAAEAKTEAKP